MKKMYLAAAAVLLAVLTVSCTTFKVSGMQYGISSPSYTVIESFETDVKVLEFFGTAGGSNMFNISASKMDGPIKSKIEELVAAAGGDAAIDVSIEYKATAGGYLVNMLTATIIAPARAYISGTIIKYN